MSTDERIVAAFLKLLRERGFKGTTTRALAREAGVNEVTVFRRFGDKARLAREAMRSVDPAPALERHQPQVDPSTPARAREGLVACLRYLRSVLVDRPEAVLPLPHPEVSVTAVATAGAARALLERALNEARLQLRPEVDVRAAAITLQALVFMTVVWRQEPTLRLNEREWDRLLENAVRPLLRAPAL
jgi:AcrR family transcriptional regulator